MTVREGEGQDHEGTGDKREPGVRRDRTPFRHFFTGDRRYACDRQGRGGRDNREGQRRAATPRVRARARACRTAAGSLSRGKARDSTGLKRSSPRLRHVRGTGG
jgi:hypothetical protein